ncbi:hypothetical protein L3X38_029967 [Prunus dulcis]|uniref:Uncharacterized protein n=1 Tax=Prunus dulcis TaxID=3755 RepID=A0AAD4VSM1_PRUDU|nr:hypothetical protein L3X38_029967 [Prunus dulcis]
MHTTLPCLPTELVTFDVPRPTRNVPEDDMPHRCTPLPQALNKVDILQSGSCEKMNAHKAEGLNMGADMMGEVYHMAMEEGLKSSHMHRLSQ